MEEEKMSIGGIFSLLHYGCIKEDKKMFHPDLQQVRLLRTDC